jgi:hypothetical protein
LKGPPKNRKHRIRSKRVYSGVILLALGLGVSCLPGRYSVPSVPSRIESIEGYGAIRITGDQGSSKIRFSFLFSLPHRGRIESFDYIGRSLYYILIDKEKSFFVLPSKKVYWQGKVEEITSRSLGFCLNQYEMVSLLSGQWTGEQISLEAKKALEKWNLERDGRGRIVTGEREEFRFEVQEYFADTPFARLLLFFHPWSKGRLKILKLNFNQAIRPAAFSQPFLERYELKSWAEIEELLANES